MLVDGPRAGSCRLSSARRFPRSKATRAGSMLMVQLPRMRAELAQTAHGFFRPVDIGALLQVIDRMRSAMASIENGLVSTAMPGSR